MNIQEQIGFFLFRFKQLKSEIKNSPRNLTWLSNERKELQELCYELESNYHAIAKFLATKSSRHTFISVPFETDWKDYENNYRKFVSESAAPAKERSLKELEDSLKSAEENWIQAGKTKEEFWKTINEWTEKVSPLGSAFDPLTDDPASLMQSTCNLLWEILAHENVRELLIPDEDYGDHYEKALGAWDFFTKTIGLNFSSIYKRWKSAPELFILPHIAQSDNTPLIELYSEAVRAFVYGSRVASMAMCRSLMEHMLKKHYSIQGKDLKNIIAIAEHQFPQLKRLRMQEKRKMSNSILHDYESGSEVEDKAVIDYLRTLKTLIENVPKRTG